MKDKSNWKTLSGKHSSNSGDAYTTSCPDSPIICVGVEFSNVIKPAFFSFLESLKLQVVTCMASDKYLRLEVFKRPARKQLIYC